MYNTSNKSFILAMNNLSCYTRLVKLLFNRDGNVIPEMNTKIIKTFVEILEEGTQHEEVRKSVADLRHFDEYFMAAMNNNSLDITQDLSKKDLEISAIIMHFYTFICNICFTSNDIRDQIASKFSFIMEKINKFIERFDFSSYICTNVFECVLSLIFL